MKTKIMVIILALSLVCVSSGLSSAGGMGYSLDRAEKDFKMRQDDPSAAKIVADGLIARPLGLGVTIGGTGLFLLTLPFSLPSGSAREAAQGMIGRPGGWTFKRPLGRRAPQFEEKGVFGR